MKSARRVALVASLFVLAVTALFAVAAPTQPTNLRNAAAKPVATPAAPAAIRATRPATGDDRLDAIAAMVNDEAVLASDVEEQLYLYLQRAQARPDSAQVDTLRRQVLDQLIDEKLVLAEAKRQAVVVPDADITKQVDQAVNDVKQRLGSDAAFAQQLQAENLTEARLREKYRAEVQRNLLAKRLVDKTFTRKPVPQAEAEAYFSAHRDRFPKVPGELRLSVIQIPPTPDSLALLQGKAKAEALRRRIVAGEKFAKVAADASDDPGSAKSGGDLGFFMPGQMEPAIEAASFSQPLHLVSKPIRSAYGWHLVEPLERDTVKTVSGRDSVNAKGAPVLEAHARHILVKVVPSEKDIARSQALAERVRAEAARGANFGTLVRRYSQYDAPTGPDGDVGFVSLGTLQPSIRAGLDSLEVGQVSEVLTNQAGFNIFKLTDRHPEREYTIEEIKGELPDAVAQVQFREKYDAWLKSLRAKAQIEYRDL
ncbi:MAG: peptidylprolyl isomerase [Candidatus Eisenbacteria bacterium]